jgi:hypothetical protein
MHDDMMTRGDIKRLLNRVMVHRDTLVDEAVRRDLENLCRLTRVLFSVIEEGGTAHPNIITRGR